MRGDLLTLTVLRKRLGITQEELALALQSSDRRATQPDVSMWEAGTTRIPQEKAETILQIFRSHKSHKIDARLKAEDLSRPWDEVLLALSGVQVAS